VELDEVSARTELGHDGNFVASLYGLTGESVFLHVIQVPIPNCQLCQTVEFWFVGFRRTANDELSRVEPPQGRRIYSNQCDNVARPQISSACQKVWPHPGRILTIGERPVAIGTLHNWSVCLSNTNRCCGGFDIETGRIENT
jgi:hypothetical protein